MHTAILKLMATITVPVFRGRIQLCAVCSPRQRCWLIRILPSMLQYSTAKRQSLMHCRYIWLPEWNFTRKRLRLCLPVSVLQNILMSREHTP